MSAEENKTLVQRFFDEVCNARKLDVADELFTTDHSYHDPSIPGVSPGPEGMKQTIAVYQTGFPDAFWHVDDMFVADDKVVTRWTGTGTQTAELPGNPPIPPTGKKVSVAGVWIHRVAGGKIVESWNVWDTLGMLQQMGVVPAAGQAS
jgi:steroid delta-isomerase-like uncharacterized protein